MPLNTQQYAQYGTLIPRFGTYEYNNGTKRGRNSAPWQHRGMSLVTFIISKAGVTPARKKWARGEKSP
jgi:hypothetical protein